MLALIFPGQGSQYCGMGKDLAEAFPECRSVFEEADDALRFPISRLCFEGPDDQLRLTENTQPAILTVSVALQRLLAPTRPDPAFVAGHSLGEYSALVAAGAISFSDAVKVVRLRGRFMQEAVPVGVGAMAAVIGLKHQQVEEVCREAAQGQVVAAANINAPDQLVISGDKAAVERASGIAKQAGAKRVIPLPVSAPFHCALMKPAEERLAVELSHLQFSDLRFPLVNNVDAAVIRGSEEARSGLVRQVSSAVRWVESVNTMVAAGVTDFVEVGPGKVLSGLVRRIAPDARTLNVGTRQEIEAYV